MENNWCSANVILDAFARCPRSLVLSAVSIGPSMVAEVGYLYEYPDIEALLLCKGFRAITESEMLQILDIALTEKSFNDEFYSSNHLI